MFIKDKETMIVAIVGSLLNGDIGHEIKEIIDNSVDNSLGESELKVILFNGKQYKVNIEDA